MLEEEKMTHKEKLKKMYQELPQKGLGKLTIAPPIYRLLWKMNIKIPPPHFSSFIFLFIFLFIFYTIFLGIFGGLSLIWRQENLSIDYLLSLFVPGILFGLFMGGYYKYSAKKHKIPLWKNYK